MYHRARGFRDYGFDAYWFLLFLDAASSTPRDRHSLLHFYYQCRVRVSARCRHAYMPGSASSQHFFGSPTSHTGRQGRAELSFAASASPAPARCFLMRGAIAMSRRAHHAMMRWRRCLTARCAAPARRARAARAFRHDFAAAYAATESARCWSDDAGGEMTISSN